MALELTVSKNIYDEVLKHGKIASQFLDINCLAETVSDTQNGMEHEQTDKIWAISTQENWK